MTDIEKAQTTKLYLDKLANGMNPLTGEDLPEDTVLNNIYLCRSFAYASNVFDEFIKNGCRISYNNKNNMLPFTITESQRGMIAISESPVSITTVTNRIEKVLDRNIKPLSPARVTQWLEAQGFLETVIGDDGKRDRISTEEGEKLGIETQIETFKNETIRKNYYSLNAQAFIIANLLEIANYTGEIMHYGMGNDTSKEAPQEKPKGTKKKSSRKK